MRVRGQEPTVLQLLSVERRRRRAPAAEVAAGATGACRKESHEPPRRKAGHRIPLFFLRPASQRRPLMKTERRTSTRELLRDSISPAAECPRECREPLVLLALFPQKHSASQSAETSGHSKHSHQCERAPATDQGPNPNTAREKPIREPRHGTAREPRKVPGKRSCGYPPWAP